MNRDPLAEIEVGIRGDTAVSLGHAGRKLRQALGARDVYRAADALWALVVQREAIGLTDHGALREAYGVKPEVWRLMGAKAPAGR